VCRIGAVIIPCTTLLTPKDIEYRLHVSHAKVFVTDEIGAQKLDKIKDTGNLCIRILVGPSDLKGWHSYHEGVAKNTKPLELFPALKTTIKDPYIIYFTR